MRRWWEYRTQKANHRLWKGKVNSMDEKLNTFSLEENFARLEETIEVLEAGEISLEEAFNAYSKGMSILKECNEQIDRVEKKVLKLSEQGNLEEL